MGEALPPLKWVPRPTQRQNPCVPGVSVPKTANTSDRAACLLTISAMSNPAVIRRARWLSCWMKRVCSRSLCSSAGRWLCALCAAACASSSSPDFLDLRPHLAHFHLTLDDEGSLTAEDFQRLDGGRSGRRLLRGASTLISPSGSPFVLYRGTQQMSSGCSYVLHRLGLWRVIWCGGGYPLV